MSPINSTSFFSVVQLRVVAMCCHGIHNQTFIEKRIQAVAFITGYTTVCYRENAEEALGIQKVTSSQLGKNHHLVDGKITCVCSSHKISICA
ncbi:unnamed protein product [Dicrocoelium dendriticum]|nr:unnamed protein product [Dicrocoelium dendriticum]